MEPGVASGGRIGIAGRVYVDHVFAGFKESPGLGKEIYCDSYRRSIGGGAAITAYWLGKMGRGVELACVAGAGDLPWFRKELGRVGVGTTLMRSSPLNSGVTAAITLGGDREFFTNLGANTELPEHLANAAVLRRLCSCAHLHLTVPLPRALAREVIGRARQSGLTVSLDVGYQPAWFKLPENHATLREVDFFFPNQVEAKLLGLSTRQGLRAWLGSGVGKAARTRPRWVVVKRGRLGAVAASADSYVAVKAPVMRSVDTTGAGDAFDAGFLDGFLAGGTVRDWLQRGCACGAMSVGQLGGVAAAAGRRDVDAMMEGTYGI